MVCILWTLVYTLAMHRITLVPMYFFKLYAIKTVCYNIVDIILVENISHMNMIKKSNVIGRIWFRIILSQNFLEIVFCTIAEVKVLLVNSEISFPVHASTIPCDCLMS